MLKINGYELFQTCGACPEQYNVLKDGVQVAYLRLRHGEFRADVPDVYGETIYESSEMKGDGIFEYDERDRFLQEAINAIDNYYNPRAEAGK